jgi:phage tail-like protein
MKHMRPSPALSLLILIATLPLIAAPSIHDRPGYASAQYVLELDGAMVGHIMSADGGNPYGEVVNEQVGTDRIQRKHVARTKYEDITLTCGAEMSPELSGWLKGSLVGQGSRKNGAVVMVDQRGQVLDRLDFYNAIINEVSFPVFDSASKDTGKITLKLSCGYTQRSYPGGSVSLNAFSKQQKRWQVCNFQLKIDGLDQAVARTSKIEAITVTQNVSKNAVGNAKGYYMDSTFIDVSHLTITVPDDYADSLRQWMDNFVINGNRGDERAGVIDVLGPNRQDILFSLTLSNLGIFKLTPDQTDAGNTGTRKIKADIYCEGVNFINMDDANTTTSSRKSG